MGQISKTRFVAGITIFIAGFASPLLIPLVTSTNWSIGVKTTVSGLLALGIPEIMIFISVAVLGKDGYNLMKSKLSGFLQRFAPPDEVSSTRYYFGLVLFIFPLLMGWVVPYLMYFIDWTANISIWAYLIGDILFISSFIILGGNFWDKFRSLFIRNAVARFGSNS